MTNRELIDLLSQADSDADVLLETAVWDGCDYEMVLRPVGGACAITVRKDDFRINEFDGGLSGILLTADRTIDENIARHDREREEQRRQAAREALPQDPRIADLFNTLDGA